MSSNESKLKEYEAKINQQVEYINIIESKLNNLYSSYSWRITRPLRLIELLANKIFHKVITVKESHRKKKLLKAAGVQPSVIIYMDGGFASQIFQYALGINIEKNGGRPIKFDLSWYKKHGMALDGINKREFLLLKLFPSLDFIEATAEEIELHKKHFSIYNKDIFIYNDNLKNNKAPVYIHPYYSHWKYILPVINDVRKRFDFSNLHLSNENKLLLYNISKTDESVAVHIRRGDYINIGMDICTPKYYINSIKHIKKKLNSKNIKVFFFSNDPVWVNDNIAPLMPNDIDYEIIDKNDEDNGFIDLYLISSCKHQISSNSSFGYLGSLFNDYPNKIVIMPNKWYAEENTSNKGSSYAHIYPGSTVIDV